MATVKANRRVFKKSRHRCLFGAVLFIASSTQAQLNTEPIKGPPCALVETENSFPGGTDDTARDARQQDEGPAYQFPWSNVTVDMQMARGNGYLADGERLVALTLPAPDSLTVDDTDHVVSYQAPQRVQEDSRPARPDGGYLTGWLVAGPLDTEASLTAALRCADGTNSVPCEGEALEGHETRWIRYRGEGNLINLREIAGYDLSVSAVAYCEFDSDTDQGGHIHFVSQNALRIWLNGNLVFEKPPEPYEPLNWLGCGVELRQGVNSCLLVCGDTAAVELFGFALRVDGPEVTPPPPLVWNPLVPGVPKADDGRYVLLSPDWKWRAGDDPAWAAPDFDDRDWESVFPGGPPSLKSGDSYWLRIHARFSPASTQVRYAIDVTDAPSSELYLDGVPIRGTGWFGKTVNPFRHQYPLFRLPQECVLAVHGIHEGGERQLARVAVRRADKQVGEELTFLQPKRYHRLVLIFCLISYLIYYVFAFSGHPRQREGFWLYAALAVTILSLLVQDMACWTDRASPESFTWLAQALAAGAMVCAIAMTQVLARGAVDRRAVFVSCVAAVTLYLWAWAAEAIAISYLAYPLAAMELLRVWIVYALIPRRANRWYIGVGIAFFIAGQLFALGFALFKWRDVAGIGPNAHIYGFMVLIGNTLDYMAREAAKGLQELKTLTVALERRVADRTRQVEQLTHRLITAGEAERERLSRDLHDSVAQTLWSAKMTAEGQLTTGPDETQAREMVNLLEKAIGEVRTIAYGLRPPELDKLGFLQAISQLCKDFSYATGILLDYEAHGVDNGSLAPAAEVNLYRVLQEALNNVQQHAGASSVRVRLVGAFPSVILRVEDNGKGFDMEVPDEAPGGSMGLRGMEERVRLLGGKMRIRSAPGEGVRLVVEIPQRKKDD